MVHQLEYRVDRVNAEDSLLIVDDVFDSGKSLEEFMRLLRQKARRNTPKDIRIATPWYKPTRNVVGFEPNYHIHETDEWLVFPHELGGLKPEEIIAGKGDEIARLLGLL